MDDEERRGNGLLRDLLVKNDLLNDLCCVDEKRKNNNGEATLWSAEEEEEKGERRGDKGSCGGYGEVEAWADGVMDRVGVAS